MGRRGLYGLLILAGVVLVIGVTGAAYVYVSGGSGEASAPISAPELTSAEATAEGSTRFRIVPEASEVRFLIDEVLRGQPTTAIGRTDQIAGELLVDPENPAETQVGTIRVNVRTLTTDNEFRNRAIRSRILMSAQDQFEFSEFVPTDLVGLPEQTDVGEPFSFQLVGDLTVRDVTNEVTFDVTVRPTSETRLEGSAQATFSRAAYDLQIPDVPNVADVSDEVRLEIDFVAQAVDGS